MITSDQLVNEFKALREADGMTWHKVSLASHLYRSFDLPDAEAFMHFLESELPDPESASCSRNMQAAYAALAFKYPTMLNLRMRRMKFLGLSPNTTTDFEKNQRRIEDRGFKEIADLLIARTSPKLLSDQNAIERLTRQVAELQVDVERLKSEQQETRRDLLRVHKSAEQLFFNIVRNVEGVFQLVERHVLSRRAAKQLKNVLGGRERSLEGLYDRHTDFFDILKATDVQEDEGDQLA